MKERQDMFLEMFEPVKNNLWRFCLSISYNYEEAKDLLQSTIEIAYTNFQSVKNKDSFLSWLFTIASRNNNAKFGKRKNELRLQEKDYAFLASNEGNPETQTEIRLLYEALNKLSAQQREALILSEIIGLPLKEVAEIQACSLSAVKLRVHRGKIALKALLSDDYNDKNIAKRKTIEAL